MMNLEGHKVISAQEMARIEKESISHGGDDDLYMQSAGKGVAQIVLERKIHKVTLLAGKGNNGGDAFVAGIELLKQGLEVKAIHPFSLSECSPLCQKYQAQFLEKGGELTKGIPSTGLILDGPLGTGFQGEVQGTLAELIQKANQSNLPIIAIDIPSGLSGDTGKVGSVAICAELTLYLGLPKLGFFLQDGMNHIGRLQQIDFGLDVEYIHASEAKAHLINENAMSSLVPPITRTRHKYEAGYVIAIASSPGMPGAGQLTCLAALRSGAGIVRLFHPPGMEEELSHSPYELIKTVRSEEAVLKESRRAGACIIGPGLGHDAETYDLVKKVLPQLTVPCVIDADALFYLKEMYEGLKIPLVLTPHHGEMKKLLGSEKFPEDYFEVVQNFSEKMGVTVALKGAPTVIFHPGTKPLIIARGDPGMATAGTGDVLTGMIGAFLAQKLGAREAAALGVYMHALAGELAAAKMTSYDMIASDLIQSLPDIFARLKNSD